MALVVIVSLLALLTMMMVATISITDVEYRTESTAFERLRAETMAVNAVAVAQAKLVEATTEAFPDGTPKPWTSQPGAIRVHRMDGTLETLHKLYSAPSLYARTVADAVHDLPDDWAAQRESFVDLNVPEVLANGELRFPIVDPRAKTGDPLTNVEGFDYEITMGAVGPDKGENAQRLPMPVRWIYMLENGETGTLDEDGVFASFEPGVAPTTDNPIVGRFAWWVDDESSKINVNTASEGSFWDVPVADTTQERSLATRQPTRLEYSRQPGHPAAVSLSSVLLPGRRQYPSHFTAPENLLEPMQAEDGRDLWRVGRQIFTEDSDGTSFGGYRETNWAQWFSRAPEARVRQAPYASTDEMYFDGAAPADAQGGRQPHAFFARHPEAADRLARSRFFLTTESTAPEVTLFGTPRVALWPVHATALLNPMPPASPAPPPTEDESSGPGHGEAEPEMPRRDSRYDHSIASVASLNGSPYFLQRSEAGNGGKDFEVHASGANKRLYAYLQRLTGKAVPGFDRPGSGYGSFLQKYGEDRDAILLEMLDHIRCSNFGDGGISDKLQFSILCPGVEHHGFGQVTPLQPLVTGTQSAASNHAQGIGRVITVSEVALVIVCRAEIDSEGKLKGSVTANNRLKLKKKGDRELEVGLVVEGFVPAQGWADYRPFATLAMYGGAPGAAPSANAPYPSLKLNGFALTPITGSTSAYSPEMPPAKWQGAGGSIGLRCLSQGVVMFQPIVIESNEEGEIPPLSFIGGSTDAQQLKLALYDSPSSTSRDDLLQVIPLKLPDIPASAGIKLPMLPQDLTTYPLTSRVKNSADKGTPLISVSDVVQSLAPVHGDYRLTATQRWSESRNGTSHANALPVFVPHPLWGRQGHAHTLHDPTLPKAGLNRGYIPALSYAANASSSDLPGSMLHPDSEFCFWDGRAWTNSTLTTALNSLRRDQGERGLCFPEFTGDFDNGTGNVPDGPYTNRPDDGNWAAAITNGKMPYFDNVAQVGSTVPPVSLSTFSAQRLFPSPVVFGSLPTGTRAHVPWQTLLFRPQSTHYGAKTPPDHLLLDLFWSPVMDPEPISLGWETRGKINLNHEMLPFRHIERSTALHALLKGEAITAIPDSAAGTYKSGAAPDDRFRRYIDVKATLGVWKRHVADRGNAFLTASQVCEEPLIPEGLASGGEITMAEVNEYWSNHRLTGDNTKERPYARLYSRLTTRSNTYRVHFIAQSLKKARGSNPATFDSTRDRVTAVSQGSTLLYRTLKMDDPAIPNYLNTATGAPLSNFYQWSRGNVEK